MNFGGVDLICPVCRSDLAWRGDEQALMGCLSCGRGYPVLHGIPDLRVQPDPYIGIAEDRAKGLDLAAKIESLSFAEAVGLYYRLTPQVTAAQAAQFTRGVVAAPARAAAALEGWEQTSGAARARNLLDVGCGTGALLVVAGQRGDRAVGVDIAFRWLIMAQKRLAEAGVKAPLVCAGGEALPFRPSTFDRVVLDSIIEHSQDQPRVLSECYRVAVPGAWLFAATPNKFSMGPDPHAGLWLGGLLPEKAIAAYVRRQGGIPPVRRLLAAGGFGRLLSASGFAATKVYLPAIPESQRESFGSAVARAAAIYERLREWGPARIVLRAIGPVLHAVAQKNPRAER